MEKKNFTKGMANRDTLADRMKRYEAITTESNLIERLPIYCRVDMRAGHTWCRGLEKPFDKDYVNAMREATKYILEKTGAVVASTQSDEASFVWLEHTKIPFETRLFKLQSVIASMFTGAFIKACIGTKLEYKVWKVIPSFDCRVLNLPSLSECANMLLWRENDSIKNSITLLALESFSTQELDKKSSQDKIKMLLEKGIDYYSLDEDLRFGAYYMKETYKRELTEEDKLHIPPDKIPAPDEDGIIRVTRRRVIQVKFGMPLVEMKNKESVLFNKGIPEHV